MEIAFKPLGQPGQIPAVREVPTS